MVWASQAVIKRFLALLGMTDRRAIGGSGRIETCRSRSGKKGASPGAECGDRIKLLAGVGT